MAFDISRVLVPSKTTITNLFILTKNGCFVQKCPKNGQNCPKNVQKMDVSGTDVSGTLTKLKKNLDVSGTIGRFGDGRFGDEDCNLLIIKFQQKNSLNL